MTTQHQSHIWINMDNKRRCIICDISWHPARDKSQCSSNHIPTSTPLKDIKNVNYN